MKTKLFLPLMCIFLLFSLCSCTQTVPIERYEENRLSVGPTHFYVRNIPYDLALEYIAHYNTSAYRYFYLPMEGDFVTVDGVAFTSRVETVNAFNIYAHPSNPYSRSIEFVLSIYSADGSLLVSETLTSFGTSSIENVPEVEVSEAMAPYWSAVVTLSDALLTK